MTLFGDQHDHPLPAHTHRPEDISGGHIRRCSHCQGSGRRGGAECGECDGNGAPGLYGIALQLRELTARIRRLEDQIAELREERDAPAPL